MVIASTKQPDEKRQSHEVGSHRHERARPASRYLRRQPRHGRGPLPAQHASHAAAATWWQPTNSGPNNGPEWQWELDHPLRVGNAADMGTGATNAAGAVAANPTVYDIDGIENPASTVTALHNLGDKVICYVEIGSAGNYYAAADEGIPVTYYAQLKAAGDLGAKMAGYPEYYLNVNAPSTVSIVESMIRQQCAAKGFDAVEPDIGDSYTDNNGFGTTEAQNAAYDNTLGTYAHSLGLAWGRRTATRTRPSPRCRSRSRTSCSPRSATTTTPARR